MLAIVIGASRDAIHAITVAQRLGYEVWAFDGDPQQDGMKTADRSFCVDIRDKANIIHAMGERCPDIILPVPIGRYLIITAQLNDYWNLPGIRGIDADICTDKWKFHNTLFSKGLRNGQCFLLQYKEDLPQASDLHFPMILKPRFGSGSRNVYYTDSFSTLYSQVSDIYWNEDYILETAAQGEEYGVDGAVFDGVFHMIALRKKINTPPPARQCVGYMLMPYETPVFREIKAYLTSVLQCMDFSSCLLHADIIFNDTCFCIELAGRPSGHYLHDVFLPLVTGVDPVEQFIRFSQDKAYSFSTKSYRPSMICFFDFDNCEITSVPDESKLKDKYDLLRFCCNIKQGDRMDHVKNCGVMQRGYFILQADDEYSLVNQAQSIVSEFGTDEGI